MAEYNLRTSMMTSLGDLTPFITRPISAFFLVSAAIYVGIVVRRSLKSGPNPT